MLLYIAWYRGGEADGRDDAGAPRAGVLAVRVDTTRAPFILADPSWNVGGGAEDPMQTWGRQPLG